MGLVLTIARRTGRSAPTIVHAVGGGPSAAVSSASVLDVLVAAPSGTRRRASRTVIGPWDWGAAVTFAPPPTQAVAPASAPPLVRRAVRRRLVPPPAPILLASAGFGTPGRHPLRVNFSSTVKTVDFS